MSGAELSYELLFIAIVRKFKLSFKEVAEKYLVHRFKYFLHNSRPFKVPMQATASILSHIISCFMKENVFCISVLMQKSILHSLIWFGLADACVLYIDIGKK